MARQPVLPTRELALAGYPQRELDAAPPWQDNLRRLRAAAQPTGGKATLPERVQRGLDAARARIKVATEVNLQRSLPKLRARIRHGGLRGSSAGWALALAEHMAKKQLGLTPYPTQLLAAWLMLDGQFAEVATGEGKTLAAGLAAAAAALAGVPVHLLTANDYLVQRDLEKMEPIYAALGLSSACVLPTMTRPERAAAYRCDIVYLTARELTFDYLRDHLLLRGVRDPRLLHALAITASESAPMPTDFGDLRAMFGTTSQPVALDVVAESSVDELKPVQTPDSILPTPVLPGLCMAIIDEADSILLDEATVPLILASPVDMLEGQSFIRAMEIARKLRRGRDYDLDASHRRCLLNDEGRAAVALAVDDLTAIEGEHHGLLRPLRRAYELVEAALSGLHGLARDRDYVIVDGKLQLIDEVTGRIADGRQWTGPLQAMVELKEGLKPSPSTRVSAQITYQRFFPRYLRMGGMSGTLAEARHELRVCYDVRVQRVPLVKPDRRQWLGQQVFVDTDRRDEALVARVQSLVAKGRPVLIGTDSVSASMRVAMRLKTAGVKHQLLNATQDAHEAACIARAGQAGVVTVATNIAGRGTDISLDADARQAGGLHVIATMRNRSRRIDRQLIGRAARHGDPGSAEAMLALDDTLVAERCPSALRSLLTHSARHGIVPAALAKPAMDLIQRRAEASDEAQRTHLRRGDQHAEEVFAFAGGTE